MHIAPGVDRRLFFSAAVLLCAFISSSSFAQPVGDWQFNGVGQTVQDASGQNNDGVLGDTAGVEGSDPSRIVSLFGDALNFSGGQYVTVPSSSSLEPATVSVEAWVRSVNGGGGAFSYILSKGADDCNAGSYGMFLNAAGAVVFMIYDGVDFYISPDTGASLWDGEWHHVAGTYDGSDVRMYLDGGEVGTATPAAIAINYALPDGDDLYIGAFRGSCDLLFDGDIDAVRVWPRALDAGEISMSAASPPVAIESSSFGAIKAQYD